MLTLTPVVEVRAPDQSAGWVALGSDTSEEDIARVVAALANYNGITESASVKAVVHELARTGDDLIAPGGLMIRAAGFESSPSCCCGLETWREWFQVKPGGSSPWLGHGPSPWVDCKADAAIIWADGDLGEKSPCITIAYDEIQRALRDADQALSAFVARLSDWLSKNDAANADFVRRFSWAFDVA
jgi:hypothetical protein